MLTYSSGHVSFRYRLEVFDSIRFDLMCDTVDWYFRCDGLIPNWITLTLTLHLTARVSP